MCGGQLRLIAFIAEDAQIRKIPGTHRRGLQGPTHIPARGPPRWDDCDAQVDDAARIKPDSDLAAQLAPDFDVDQRVNW